MNIGILKNIWRSWIPNGLSLGNLTFGFFSIIVSSHSLKPGTNDMNTFLIAGMLIMIAALFDGIDGPVARWLGVQSDLGEQLDSLADLTTFGLAPGALMYFMYFSHMKMQIPSIPYPIPTGLMLASLFPICTAFRLARFNVTHDPGSFTGLPSPVAGLSIAFLPFFTKYSGKLPLSFSLTLFIVMALLMVSNIRYTKPQMTVRAHFTAVRLVLFAALIASLMIWLGWYWVILGVTTLYVFSGLIALLLSLFQKLSYRLRT